MRDSIDYKIVPVRTAAILTGSYVAGTVISHTTWRYNQLVVMIQITLGSLTSVEIKVDFSMDNTTWFQKAFDVPVSSTQLSVESGEYTFTVAGNYPLEVNSAYNFIRVSAKGTGNATGSSCTIDAILARN